MDILYIGDIPKEYHFAVFGSNYIDLYNTSQLQGTLDYYRVYMYENQFAYEKRTNTYSLIGTSTAKNIEVSDSYLYRRDFPHILTSVFIFSIFFVFLLNIFTSIFKKGGVFGGLL